MSFGITIDSPGNNGEMDDTNGAELLGGGISNDFLLGLSQASLKKYSSAYRKRYAARQAAKAMRQASATPNELMGFGFGDVTKTVKKAAKKVKKAAKKIDVAKVKAVVQTVGPVVATVYPPAAPFVGAATIALNAIDKKDPAALAKLAATQAAAASGSPEAVQALQMLEVAKDLKNNLNANKLMEAAAAGSPEAAKKIAEIKAAASSNPTAAASLKALDLASKGKAALKKAGGKVQPSSDPVVKDVPQTMTLPSAATTQKIPLMMPKAAKPAQLNKTQQALILLTQAEQLLRNG